MRIPAGRTALRRLRASVQVTALTAHPDRFFAFLGKNAVFADVFEQAEIALLMALLNIRNACESLGEGRRWQD